MNEQFTDVYAVLPLRDIVVFPNMIAPLFVGRDKSITALEEVVKQNCPILLVTQKDASLDDPEVKDLHEIGVLANVLQLLKLPDGTVKVLVEGQHRAKIKDYLETNKIFRAHIQPLFDEEELGSEVEALSRSVVTQFERYVKLNKKVSPEVVTSLAQIDEASKLVDTIASHLTLKVSDRQKVLEEVSISKRLELVYSFMETEIEVLNAEQQIRSRVKKQMEKTQKEYYLNEQLKAIHKELGEDENNELDDLQQKIETIKLTKEASDKAKHELKKLRNMSPMSAEAGVIRNYLDWLVTLPWNKRSKVKRDLPFAQTVLDEDHYGLEKVKERILEYLAVQQRTRKMKGPILCLVGPPGVGKTSLARSIANATGRKFAKVALGGVRDESEIRGHRRTYIGSMPGRIIQSMKKVGTSNPLFLLDEIDKMGTDYRGDPASALLEVLDPEQNQHFNDHYMEVDYDLSDVMFVATSNSMNIPAPLLDRMEVIRLSGYTEEEKIEIAKRHLIRKQTSGHGLKKGEWSVEDDAIRDLIRYYTREAGVRNLQREIASLTRKAVKKILMEKDIKSVEVTSKNLNDYAGVRRFSYGLSEEENLTGIVSGLAYTEAGGDLLTIEAVSLPGKGTVKTTGKLGDVMQESAQAAFSYARSRSITMGIIPPKIQSKDIHIHVPEGATPKDGPSAGVTMCTAIVSVLTGIPVKKSVAMTGEITLRGRVLPIGGLKEKLLAALRGGIKTVIIPQENEKDLVEIPENARKGLEIIPVSTMDEVLKVALTRMPEPVEWTEADEIAAATTTKKMSSDDGATLHH